MTIGTRQNHLIVTADDFGLSIEVNEAVELAHRDGILSAASLMVAGPAAADAIRRARELTQLRVGLHLTLVDGRPSLPPAQIPDLVNGKGELRSDMTSLAFAIVMRPSVRRQVSAELKAQFEAFAATGLNLDHVNVHKHFHLHPVIAEHIIALGKRYGMKSLRVPSEPGAVLARVESQSSFSGLSLMQPWTRWLRTKARRAGIASPDAVFGLRWSGAMTARRLAGLLENLPPGAIEIYTHPGVCDDFPGHAAGYGYSSELAALRHPDCSKALFRSGYRLGGYGDMGQEAQVSPPHQANWQCV